MTITGCPSKLPMPPTDGFVVAKAAVAVQLLEIRDQPVDVIAGVRTFGVTCELNPLPTGGYGGLLVRLRPGQD